MADSDDYLMPGQLITSLMAERGWSNRVLAVVLDIDETVVSKLLSGKRSLDAVMAIALEDVFGTPAERFLDLQQTYDLAQARLASKGDPNRATRAQLFGELPVAEMIKRGWINAESVRDVQTVHSELLRFFDVNRVEDIEGMSHSAKKTYADADPTMTQYAWLYRVRQIAKGMLVAKYSPAAIGAVIAKLKSLLLSAEEVRKVPKILGEAGIRFVIVEALPSSKIDGVCFWLAPTMPVIALSMRFDRIDNFWFVLRHELEHVALGHGQTKAMLDTDIEGRHHIIAAEEMAANKAAAEYCVPAHMMDAFVARKAPFFKDADIVAFSRMLKVHPGIVAGQLRRRLQRYDRFGSHLVKVRHIISPNAITDGWGDVAPLGL